MSTPVGGLLRFPFALPERFAEAIGYRGRHTLVGLYWERAGDELTVYDPNTLWCGAHDHWPYLDLVQRPQVMHWLDEHLVELGASDAAATHHAVLDVAANALYLAPAEVAEAVVARQRLGA